MAAPVRGYCTKYALTRGIVPVTVEVHGEYAYGVGALNRCQMRIGRDFFEDMQAAREDAKARARRKLASIDKVRKRIAALADEPKEGR